MKRDWLLILGIIIILLVGLFLLFYYFNNQNQECIKNPFVFGAKQLEDKYNKEVYGTVILLHPGSPIWEFNSTIIMLKK